MTSAVTDPLTLTISDVGYRGRGVARDGGRVVFVPGVLEGETVRVRITHTHKRFADAELLEVIEPSPQRVVPACPLALRAADAPDAPDYPCVGCAYQHIDYAEEVQLKQRQLAALLQRMARLDAVPFDAPAASPHPLGYRNKITLHAGDFQGRRVLGYIGSNNHTIVDVPACPLAHPAINARLAEVRAEKEDLRRSAVVTLRHTAADGVRVGVRGVTRLSGWLTEASPLGELTVPAGGFTQVNPAVADLLVEHVRGMIAASACAEVLDLYCGVGLFGLAAGLAGKRVLGIDSDGRAIEAARMNAQARGLSEVAFEEGLTEEVLETLLERMPLDDTLVIVDPPRTGLDPRARQALAAAPPRELIYISCAPDTLARDLGFLTPAGWTIEKARLFDMFPRTACFETVVRMRRH